jgi:threonine/homoserine/homoserine lactone efflux protein
MPLPVFAAAVFLAAFVMSLPIGPIQLEIWRTSLAGHKAHAAAYQAGSVIATIGWVLVAAFGADFIWKSSGTAAAACFLYAALLIGLGTNVVRKTFRPPSPPLFEALPASRTAREKEGSLRWALLRGFLLLAMNPLAVASWTVVLAWLIRWGAAPPVRLLEAAVCALSIAVGMSVYPALIIVKARRWIPKRARAGSPALTRLLGGGLIAFGLYFLYRAVSLLGWI